VGATIQFKRGTEARWDETDPVLKAGEPGYATDSSILKIGDGTRHWSQLDPIGEVDEAEVNAIIEQYLIDNPIEYAELNVTGPGKFIILEHDTDASTVPDGTFIARLPSDWTP